MGTFLSPQNRDQYWASRSSQNTRDSENALKRQSGRPMMKMNPDPIAEIEIDRDGRLRVVPSSNTYPLIYREAVEVHWDSTGRFLYSPPPREWSYFDWFKHIIDTAGDLVLSPDTKWINVPDQLRRDAEAWMDQRA